MDTGEGGGILTPLGRLVGLSLATCLTFDQRPIVSHLPSTRRNTVGAAFIHCWLFLRPGGLAGHIMSYRYLGKDMVILSSVNAIKDLLEKRGNVYSDRAPMPFLDMCVSRICRWYDPADL